MKPVMEQSDWSETLKCGIIVGYIPSQAPNATYTPSYTGTIVIPDSLKFFMGLICGYKFHNQKGVQFLWSQPNCTECMFLTTIFS